jgi:signal peptidase I
MEPSLNDGDIVLLVKTDNLHSGDLCAFYFSNKIAGRSFGEPSVFTTGKSPL